MSEPGEKPKETTLQLHAKRSRAFSEKHRISSAERLEKLERVFALMVVGKSERQIAVEMGVSPSGAHAMCRAIIDIYTERRGELADKYRSMELQRLEHATAALAPKVKKGNLLAIDRWVRLSESRRKLLGVDAPTKQAVSGPDGGPVRVEFVFPEDGEQPDSDDDPD